MLITDRNDYKRLRRLGLSRAAAKRNAARRNVDFNLGDHVIGIGCVVLLVSLVVSDLVEQTIGGAL